MYKDFEKKTLAEVLKSGQITAPAFFDGISVRTIELSGYEGCILSGTALSYVMNGVPDIGMLNTEEVIYMTNRMTNYTHLPVIVDADVLGETTSAVWLNVMRLAKSGADAVVVSDAVPGYGEDRKFDKSYKASVASKELFLQKIKAALDAVKNTKCQIIAKTYAKDILGLEEAIDRVVSARKIGADYTCVKGAKTIDDAKKISVADSGLKMWDGIVVEDGKVLTEPKDLEKLGFAIVAEYYTVKGGMFGMVYYGKKVREDGNTVFHDTHDYDGILRKGQDYHELFSFHKLWLPMEDEFYDLSDIMAKEHEIKG
ncbi:MAG: isocitrate lyase/PEP mutase family protein [Sphaerochaetaceae bacterium]|nr:isocitrate lyase/PEP mutase family protein [Sphaerochaetaceae bacterium]